MVQGFQGDDLSRAGSIAACAKHFAAYGAVESGRDYASTNIPETELRNVYLPPFKAAVDTGVATLMTSFSDLNGVPASANAFLLRQVLRDEWNFDGFVVSDWDSIRQLQIHGLTENDRESAFEAARAGVDMEMAGDAYSEHLAGLVEAGRSRRSTPPSAMCCAPSFASACSSTRTRTRRSCRRWTRQGAGDSASACPAKCRPAQERIRCAAVAPSMACLGSRDRAARGCALRAAWNLDFRR